MIVLTHSKMCTLTSAGTAMKPHNCGNPRATKINKQLIKNTLLTILAGSAVLMFNG